MGTPELVITSVAPGIGITGGEISIRCRGFVPGLPSSAMVLFGGVEGTIVSASEERVIVRVPENAQALGVALYVNGSKSEIYPVTLGSRLATGLHPVMNPVIAPDGAIITTVSGARGQQASQSLMRVSRAGQVTAYGCEIMNPTGLAFGPDAQLYISCRADGTVLRYADFERLDVVAENLGTPCGLAFDSGGALYVGDRTGKIFRVNSSGERTEFASIPPSVSAFHLAFDRADNLFVSGPTLAMRDPIYRISRKREVSLLVEGFARPQGIAIDEGGDLLVAAAYRGQKGVFRVSMRKREPVHYIAGPMLVGLALDGRDVFLVDSNSIFWVQRDHPSAKLS